MKWFFGILALVALGATIVFPFLAPLLLPAAAVTTGTLVGVTAALGGTTVGLTAATVVIHRGDQNQQRVINDLRNQVANFENNQLNGNQRQENLANAIRDGLSSMPPGHAPKIVNVNVTDNSTNKNQYNPTKLTATDHSNLSGVDVANGPRP